MGKEIQTQKIQIIVDWSDWSRTLCCFTLKMWCQAKLFASSKALAVAASRPSNLWPYGPAHAQPPRAWIPNKSLSLGTWPHGNVPTCCQRVASTCCQRVSFQIAQVQSHHIVVVQIQSACGRLWCYAATRYGIHMTLGSVRLVHFRIGSWRRQSQPVDVASQADPRLQYLGHEKTSEFGLQVSWSVLVSFNIARLKGLTWSNIHLQPISIKLRNLKTNSREALCQVLTCNIPVNANGLVWDLVWQETRIALPSLQQIMKTLNFCLQ